MEEAHDRHFFPIGLVQIPDEERGASQTDPAQGPSRALGQFRTRQRELLERQLQRGQRLFEATDPVDLAAIAQVVDVPGDVTLGMRSIDEPTDADYFGTRFGGMSASASSNIRWITSGRTPPRRPLARYSCRDA